MFSRAVILVILKSHLLMIFICLFSFFFVWSACPMVWVSVYITVLFGYLLSVVLLRICDYYICMKCLCKIWKYKWMHCSKAAHRFSASLKNSNLYLSILRNSVEIKWRLLCVSIYVTGWVVQQHTLILTAFSTTFLHVLYKTQGISSNHWDKDRV